MTDDERERILAELPPCEDPLVRYKREQNALIESRERARRSEERQQRIERRHRERERIAIEAAVAADIDARVAEAVRQAIAQARKALLDEVIEIVGEGIGQYLRQELGAMEKQLGKVENLIRSARVLPETAEPLELPPLRSMYRDVN
jgi:predicted NBD/HSP70 family sugar kinase